MDLTHAVMNDLKEWMREHGIDTENFEKILIDNDDATGKVSVLIDLMAKNRLQSHLTTNMLSVLDHNTAHSMDSVSNHFPLHLLNKDSLSKGARRNFDSLVDLLNKSEIGPKADFEFELESSLKEHLYENEYIKTRIELGKAKNELLEGEFQRKLKLRDTL